ncbi:MAG TPA: Xaa-Pro peptidase family protein [Terriglobales bacterium]|nr:Xaa-Pro peptidase family protein [Terriglobales bacterium]
MRKTLIAVLLLASTFCLALERQPNADYRARRVALSKLAGDHGMFLVFAGTESEGPNAVYGFRQNEDFYYLTGIIEPGGVLLVAPAVEAKGEDAARAYSEVLFLPVRNAVEEKWTGIKPGPADPDIRERTGVDRVAALDRMRDELIKIAPQGQTTVFVNKSAETDAAAEWLQRTNSFPGFTRFEDGSDKIAEIRSIKDAGELALLKKAADATAAAHLAAMKAMKPGVTEHEIGALMTYEYARRGCERPAYAPIVGSGFNSTVLHYSAGPRVIKDGDIVVIDVGGEYSMYANDTTRTIPANGKFTARQREIYNVVLGAAQAAIAAFKSGESTLDRQKGKSLHLVAYDYINTHGKDLKGKPLGKYFIHGLGHRVGLNVHDPGPTSKPLGPGEVFTIEPGIYIPEENLGVRIEDTFYVDENGKLINLTGSLPKTADEIERAMQK